MMKVLSKIEERDNSIQSTAIKAASHTTIAFFPSSFRLCELLQLIIIKVYRNTT